MEYTDDSTILYVGTYKNSQGRRVQIIRVSHPANIVSTIEFGRFVVYSYDLTFLRNFFDGVNVYTYDFLGVVQKRGSITPHIRSACSISSLTAYNQERFRNWYRAITATTVRCLKYQKLGFQIDNVPDFSLVNELAIL